MSVRDRRAVSLWVRWLLGIERLIAWFATYASAAHEQTVLSWVPQRLWNAISFSGYDNHPAYTGAGIFGPTGANRGLLPWEEQSYTRAPFPSRGHVLLGAAGSGRELRWLCERGYSVTAFEPSNLAEIARQKASPAAEVIRAEYDDLVLGIESKSGPLVGALAGRSFDAVILGWGSLSYVWSPRSRVRLLAALRAHSPDAPVFLSFVRRPEVQHDPVARFRHRLSRVYAICGAPNRSTDNLHYFRRGFTCWLTASDIEELAGSSGYRLERLQLQPYGHAVMVRGAQRASGGAALLAAARGPRHIE
jgi:hypothetical protein